jgi:hypothetical protein
MNLPIADVIFVKIVQMMLARMINENRSIVNYQLLGERLKLMKVNSKPSSKPYKTLFDWCPTEENLKEEIRKRARRLKVISSDNLHDLDYSVKLLGRDTRIYGALLKAIASEGMLKKGDYIPSEREECHGRPIIQWIYVEGT